MSSDEVVHEVGIDHVGGVYHNLECLKHHGYEVVPLNIALDKGYNPCDSCYE